MLDLTPDQVADAEEAGVSFPPATPQQVQRYAMQKKVFRIGGAAVLATRDGALFETAGTLERLIAEGERQRRDLAEWEAAPPPPPRMVEARTRPPPPSAEEPELPPALRALPAPLPAKRAKTRRVPRGERWRTAGALRRGRLAQHWSLRGAPR
jgi:hypothetical protein